MRSGKNREMVRTQMRAHTVTISPEPGKAGCVASRSLQSVWKTA